MKNIDSIVKKYLKECGIRDAKINTLHGDTSLYHDLGVYGDIAEGYLDLLVDNYGVDVSTFDFHKYFPEEFSGEKTFKIHLFTIIPFLRERYNNKKIFKPLTLGMIALAIQTGSLE